MSLSEKELEEQLKEAGLKLLNPPSSTEELLIFLDKAECLITNVEQSPPRSMQDALLPLMKALISDELLKHMDTDVKVSVTSCVTEITRITAPDAPYDDEKMKVIFQLTIEAFQMLSDESGPCYTRAMSILDTVSRVRSCLVMLDLECDNLVLEMVRNFLKLIRSNHPHTVFSAMESIMTTVINESEEISFDLLSTILATVRKENQEVAPISWKLGEKVISNCAAKLQPYLKGAVQSIGTALDDYAPIVASICRNEMKGNIDAGKPLANEKSLEKKNISNESPKVTKRHMANANVGENPRTENDSVSLVSNVTISTGNGCVIKASSRKSQQHQKKQSKTTDPEVGTKPNNLGSTEAENALDSVPKKRGRKPNSLMNPEEGYDNSWIGTGRKNFNLANRRKSSGQIKLSPVKLSLEKGSLRAEVKKESSARVEEKGMQSEDAVVSKTHKDMKKMDEKTQGRSRKSKIVKCTKNKATLDPGCIVSEEKSSAHSDRKEKQSEDLVMKSKEKSTNEDGSLIRKDVRMTSAGADMDRNVRASSTHKKSVSRSSAKLARDDDLEETPKSKVGRKHGIMKEEAMEISDPGEELVGRRLKIWWPMDKKFYEGVVHSFDPVKQRHKVSYNDGDEEILNLKKQRFELIGGDVLPDEDEEKDVKKAEASSDTLQKRRRKTKSESPNEEKPSSSTRRGRPPSKNKKSKAESLKSSKKTAVEKPVISEESKNEASSSDNMKNSRTRSSTSSKQGELASSAMEESE